MSHIFVLEIFLSPLGEEDGGGERKKEDNNALYAEVYQGAASATSLMLSPNRNDYLGSPQKHFVVHHFP